MHAVYAASVVALWLTGGPTPPATINSIVVASAVSAVVLATRRCPCQARLADLEARVSALEEAPPRERVYVVTPQRRGIVEPTPSGIDPDSIGALRRVHDRLNGDDG